MHAFYFTRNYVSQVVLGGTRWRSWMGPRASSLKVVGSIARWRPWNFSVTSFQLQYGHGVDSDPNRKEYHGISWAVKRPVCRADNLTVVLCRLP